MWIDHIGEIAMGFFIVLLALHFAVHFWFKWQKQRQSKKHIKKTQKS